MHLSTKVLILVVVLAIANTEVANAGPAPGPDPMPRRRGRGSGGRRGTLFNKSKLKFICDCNFNVKTQNERKCK